MHLRACATVAFVVVVCIASAITLVLGAAEPPPPEFQPCPQCGIVRGQWEEVTEIVVPGWTPRKRTVAKFLGLPYVDGAAMKRFDPPVPLPAVWPPAGTVFNATQSAQFCVQGVGAAGPSPSSSTPPLATIGSEFCLFLNIFIPRQKFLNRATRLHPVNVYIFGGSLISGSAPPQSYFSAFTGNDGAVSVTLQGYRLSILGFLGAPAFRAKSAFNLGIQDQRAALRWVQRFGSAFGADKKRVTISGQSSGGTSAFALLACETCGGLFRNVWSFSGSPNISMTLSRKLAQDAPILASLGCAAESTQIECLRNKTLAELFAAVPESWNTPGLFSLADLRPEGRNFAGLVFVDGAVVTTSFEDSLNAPWNKGKNVIISNSAQEDNLISPHEGQDVTRFSQEQWRFFLRRVFAPWGTTSSIVIADAVDNYYAAEGRPEGGNPQMAYASINADYGVNCAAWALAKKSQRTVRLFIGINQWLPSHCPSPPAGPLCMSYHMWTWSVAIMSGELLSDPQPSDIALSNLVRAQWSALMQTGDPSVPYFPWRPASAGSPTPGDDFFVWRTPNASRYPFYNQTGMNSGTNPNVTSLQVKCDFLVGTVGLGTNFWWCD